MGGGALPGRPKIRQWLGHIGQLPDWLCGTSVLRTGRRGEGRGVRLPCSQVVWLDSPRSPRPPLSPSTPQHTHTTPEEARFQPLVLNFLRSLRTSQSFCQSGQRWVGLGCWSRESSCWVAPWTLC